MINVAEVVTKIEGLQGDNNLDFSELAKRLVQGLPWKEDPGEGIEDRSPRKEALARVLAFSVSLRELTYRHMSAQELANLPDDQLELAIRSECARIRSYANLARPNGNNPLALYHALTGENAPAIRQLLSKELQESIPPKGEIDSWVKVRYPIREYGLREGQALFEKINELQTLRPDLLGTTMFDVLVARVQNELSIRYMNIAWDYRDLSDPVKEKESRDAAFIHGQQAFDRIKNNAGTPLADRIWVFDDLIRCIPSEESKLTALNLVSSFSEYASWSQLTNSERMEIAYLGFHIAELLVANPVDIRESFTLEEIGDKSPTEVKEIALNVVAKSIELVQSGGEPQPVTGDLQNLRQRLEAL